MLPLFGVADGCVAVLDPATGALCLTAGRVVTPLLVLPGVLELLLTAGCDAAVLGVPIVVLLCCTLLVEPSVPD